MAPVQALGRVRCVATGRRASWRSGLPRHCRAGDGVLRLGILGGTFDPVHLAHLILGEEAREQLELERVLFVPAGQPWRKAGRQIAPAKDRLAMLRLATEDNHTFEVSEVELDRAGPSYTVDTLASLKEQHAGAELFFIMGQDALSDLPNWHDPARIAQLAILAVAAREGDDALELPPTIGASVERVAMPMVAISGSDIRKRMAAGRSIRYLVPSAVEAYIREHALYRY